MQAFTIIISVMYASSWAHTTSKQRWEAMNIYEKENFKHKFILKDDCRPVAGVVLYSFRAAARRRLLPRRPPKPAAIVVTPAQCGALLFFDGAAAVRATIIGDFKLWSFYHNMQMRFMHNSTNTKTITS